MKKNLLSATIVSLSLWLTTLAQAGEAIDQTLAANPGERVEVTHVNGKVSIKGWDKNEVQVTGELSDNAEEFVFERRGSTIEITVKEKDGSWNNSKGDRLTIYLPQQSSVNYESTNGDLTLDLLDGDLNSETINGDIDLSRINGKVRVEVINGDVDSKDINGDLKLNTVNGDVTVANLRGDSIGLETVNGDIDIEGNVGSFRATTVNGDIQLSGSTVNELEVSSVNGDIDATITLAEAGRIKASSVGGDIKFVFVEQPQAKFTIDGHQGDIVNKLSDDKIKEQQYTGFQSLSFSLGDASGAVKISTIKGEIVLTR
ncbi:DUF4097 family beta strand repeat protein [Neiella sp. HB171785]|uniref:DUF4097 family beta strand repeat protein n=1 Tax=Neiella litorisoli TaxID=2771431 RepID=A0A8J6ULF1_9GAMM|nr:DUF4097 family beta strand repeat-containing protein [Neiella litorisoli]MBD1388875.1 DUF4097 family beta strand repeat protein [Neiella litorisoli]